MDVSINTERELYVLKTEVGYSCLGFDVVLREIRQMAARLTSLGWLKDQINTLQRGSKETFEIYQRAVDAYCRSGNQTATWFNEQTPKALQRVLERCRERQTLVRIWYGDAETGRSWLDENDVYGTIGRSTGTFRIPLLCARGSSGGGGLLDACIVRIDDVDTRTTLWVNKKFHLPPIELKAIEPPMIVEATSYAVEALVDGKNHARFRTWDEAGHWLAMQSGRCLDNPGWDN